MRKTTLMESGRWTEGIGVEIRLGWESRRIGSDMPDECKNGYEDRQRANWGKMD